MYLLAQGDTLDVLHRNEIQAFALANLVDVRDVRMIERGRGLGLLIEAPHAVLIKSNFGRKNLERNSAMHLGVFCEIHLTHSARPNLRADFIATELCAHR